MPNIGDIFDKSGVPHVITRICNGFTDEAIPLRDYIESVYVISTDHGTETIRDYLNRLVDEYVISRGGNQ